MAHSQSYKTDALTAERTGILEFTTASPVPNGEVVSLLDRDYVVIHSVTHPRTVYLDPFTPVKALTVTRAYHPAPPAAHIHFDKESL